MSDSAEKPADARTGRPDGNGRKVMLAALAVGLLAGGGGAAWWFLGRGVPNEATTAEHAEARRIAARQFVTLEPFVVNLADRQSERYAQVGVVLEVEGKDVNRQLADKMPAVRNEILLLISSKQAGELVTRHGKEALASEIAVAAARPLGWRPPEVTDPAPEAPSNTRAEKAGAATKPKRPAPPPPEPNPVARVHFASFIVQ